MTFEIPILDCSQIEVPFGELTEIENAQAFEEFTKKLGDGMKELGLVYLINHGVDSKAIENVLSESRTFFELPQEVKDKYTKIEKDFHGYLNEDSYLYPENGEIRPISITNQKEVLDFWRFLTSNKENYPEEVPGLKPAIDEFESEMKILIKKILPSLALYLNLDSDFLMKKHKHLDDNDVFSNNFIRCNYYKPVEYDNFDLENGEVDLRLPAHQDASTVTFLFQDDSGGLQVRKPGGEWIDVPPIKGSIVLICGWSLDRWSEKRFHAVWHQVRLLRDSAHKPRQSLGYFLQPDETEREAPVVPRNSNQIK